MKNLKKCLLLAVILVLSLNILAGCGGKASCEEIEIIAAAETAEAAVETTAATEAATQPAEETAELTVELTEEPTAAPTEPEGVPGVVVNTGWLNVRKAPGVGSEKVTRLGRGTQVTVYETVTKDGALWGRIDEGWVSMEYIELDGEAPKQDQKIENTPVEETTAPTEPEHIHSYTEKVTKPTCTQDGFTTYTCECGDSYKDNYVNSTDHRWSQWKTTKEPTETAEGKAERTCANCSEKETKTLPKVIPDHTHKYTEKVTKEPTCTSAGTKTFTCSCGDKYTESIAKAGHKYTNMVTAPTCTDKGYTTHTCGKCGDSYKDTYKNAAGHSFVESDSKKPTCTEKGYTKYSCGRCSETKTESINALNHNYAKSDSKNATCTESGYTKYTCKNCNDVKTETVNPTGHSWGSWVTVKEPTESSAGKAERTCSKCSRKESKTLDKLPPKPTEPETPPTEPEKPTECYHVSNPNFFGKYKEIAPTCTEAGYWLTKCTACGQEGPTKPSYKPATGHSYSKTDHADSSCTSEGYNKYSCSKCGHSYTETIPVSHNWEHHHEDEVGHWESTVYCHCGWSTTNPDYISAWQAHLDSLGPDDDRFSHSYWDEAKWIVDVPAKDWDTCSICGATK